MKLSDRFEDHEKSHWGEETVGAENSTDDDAEVREVHWGAEAEGAENPVAETQKLMQKLATRDPATLRFDTGHSYSSDRSESGGFSWEGWSLFR